MYLLLVNWVIVSRPSASRGMRRYLGSSPVTHKGALTHLFLTHPFPSAACMCHWTGSTLLQIMAYRHTVTGTNADLGTNISESRIKIQNFSFMKMRNGDHILLVLVNFGSDNGLLLSIIYSNDDLLSIKPTGTKFSEIYGKIHHLDKGITYFWNNNKTQQNVQFLRCISSEIILYMRPTNERRRYIVTSSIIGWAHRQNDPWNYDTIPSWVAALIYR